jgi:hypothetical protein
MQATVENPVHGSPEDRGSADSYYGRGFDPHYWPEGTGHGKRVELAEMSAQQIVDYTRGYNQNEAEGNFKDWY